MVLAHGMSEHSGRYDHVGRFLASRGLAVHALDHRGHGRSGGETGTVETFGHFLDDLSTFLSMVRAESPAGPLVLLGHSSRDPEVQRAYMEDPLVLRERVQEDLFYKLAEGVMLLVGRAGEIGLPILLIHGTADVICSAEGADLWVRSSSSPDITVQLYPEGRHEMFNEINRDEVLAGLWDWLDARLPA
jgi:alpha-beta hydrolase superfamily lysophospholipase